MVTRAVEWKKPYTWGTAITVDPETKVISLNLRDENNLIIYDAWDDEIYVDLQLPDWIKPTDAFPVWVTTGRVLVADWWDVTGTLICAKTTSGDNIKILYSDAGQLFIDNGSWTFKQIYLKAEIDILLQGLRDNILSQVVKYWLNKIYDQDTVVELGYWEVTQHWERSWHHVTIDPEWEVEVYNVNVAWDDQIKINTGIDLINSNASWDYTTSINYNGITMTDRTSNTSVLPFSGEEKLVTLTVNSTGPTTPETGKLWYYTANSVLKIYDGSARQTI